MKAGRFFAAVVLGWALLSSISLGYSGWIAGKTGNALAFDGINDYVEVPDYTGIGGASARTVSLWVKTSTTGVYQALVQWGTDATGQVWLLRIQTDGKVIVAAYGGGVTSSRVVTDNQWHHIAAVLDEGQTDSTQIRLYIDGQLDAVPVGSGTINTSQTVSVHLGVWYLSSSGSTTNYFNGLMDEVCIYGRALDASEIDPEASIPTEGLVSHWEMDEASGSIAYDTVSFYDGVLMYINGNYSSGSGTLEDPYQIAAVADWQILMTTAADWKKHFILMSDINFQGVTLIPVGDSFPFTGTFDGNHHTIRNVNINMPSSDYVGLFGNIGNYLHTGKITNLTLESVAISGLNNVGGLTGANYGSVINCSVTGSVAGSSSSQNVGGLIGSSWGLVSNCHANTVVSAGSASNSVGGLIGSTANYESVINCYATGSVIAGTDSLFVGGFVGYTYCPIVECYATGSVTAGAGTREVGGFAGQISDYRGSALFCYAAGNVYGSTNSYEIGGFAGTIAGNVSNCYASGAVNGGGSTYVAGFVGRINEASTLTNCYATGLVSNFSSYGGGLIGDNYSGAANHCFWDIDTSGQTTSEGGTGKTTAEMKTLSTFTSAAWDFANETTNGTNDIWRMCADEVDYPRLNWESIDGDFACPDGVSAEDLDYFVGRWLMDNCTSSNNYCGGGDIDSSGGVDLADYAVLAQHWLEGV